jgi:hypothetical protein
MNIRLRYFVYGLVTFVLALTLVRYFLIWPDLDRAIVYSACEIVALFVFWFYNRFRDEQLLNKERFAGVDREYLAVGDYLQDLHSYLRAREDAHDQSMYSCQIETYDPDDAAIAPETFREKMTDKYFPYLNKNRRKQ